MKHNCQTEMSSKTKFQDKQDDPCNLSGYTQRGDVWLGIPLFWSLAAFDSSQSFQSCQ